MIAVLVLFGSLLAQPQVAPAAKCVIQGTVVHGITGLPLSRARVQAYFGSTTRLAKSAITSADGKFRINGLQAGKYRIQVERLGFVSQAYRVRNLYQSLSTAIAVGDEHPEEEITFRMIPPSAITGFVTDSNGDPAVEVYALAMKISGSGAQRKVERYTFGYTDDRGYYRIPFLAAGNYVVAIYGPMERWKGPKSEGPSMAYPMAYFPGGRDAASAPVIRLEAGKDARVDGVVRQEPAGVVVGEANLPKGKQFRIRPRVVGVFGAEISLGRDEYPTDSAQGPATFRIEDLPPGRYHLYMYDGQQLVAYRAMDVAPGENRVSMMETPLAQVSASVEIRGLAQGATVNAALSLRRTEPVETTSRAIGSDGRVEFSGLAPGVYDIALTGGRFPIVAYSVKGATALGTSVDIPDTGKVELTVIADAGARDIPGVVYRGDNPEAGVLVLLVPAATWRNITTYRFDQSDSDGTFTWPAVPQGTYLMFAFDEGVPSDYYNPDVIQKLVSTGQMLVVGETPPKVKLVIPPKEQK